MKKNLEERLRDVESVLGQATGQIGGLPQELHTPLLTILRRQADIKYWIDLLAARKNAFGYINAMEERIIKKGIIERKIKKDGFEKENDEEEYVRLGETNVKFQNARFIGVQAYVNIAWALADSITALAGRILCTSVMGMNEAQPPKLVSHFVDRNNAKKAIAAPFFHSMGQVFGWPIVISYAIRNHFTHDGGFVDGQDFFEGPTARYAFRISEDGWRRIEGQAKEYGVGSSQCKNANLWPKSPRDDLRFVLSFCEREIDEALGVVIGSASKALLAHIDFLLGQD